MDFIYEYSLFLSYYVHTLKISLNIFRELNVRKGIHFETIASDIFSYFSF